MGGAFRMIGNPLHEPARHARVERSQVCSISGATARLAADQIDSTQADAIKRLTTQFWSRILN
jgi:hypothetical protein